MEVGYLIDERHFDEDDSVSITFVSMHAERQAKEEAEFRNAVSRPSSVAIQSEDKVSLLVEGFEGQKLDAAFSKLGNDDAVEHLGGDVCSDNVSLEVAKQLVKSRSVSRLQAKK